MAGLCNADSSSSSKQQQHTLAVQTDMTIQLSKHSGIVMFVLRVV